MFDYLTLLSFNWPLYPPSNYTLLKFILLQFSTFMIWELGLRRSSLLTNKNLKEAIEQERKNKRLEHFFPSVFIRRQRASLKPAATFPHWKRSHCPKLQNDWRLMTVVAVFVLLWYLETREWIVPHGLMEETCLDPGISKLECSTICLAFHSFSFQETNNPHQYRWAGLTGYELMGLYIMMLWNFIFIFSWVGTFQHV